MNGVQVKKPSGLQYNRLLDAVVTIIKYNIIKIDNAVYIKVLSGETVSYQMVSSDGVLNTTNN